MGGSTTSLTHTRRHTSRIPNLFFDDSETSEDGRKYNPAVMEFIRSDWIAGQMLGRESEFTDYRDVYAMVGTWNVNGKMPEESVASWVASLKAPDGRWPELVVVGFQEIVDLNAANVVVSAQTDKRSVQWAEKIEQTLKDTVDDAAADPYVLLKSEALVGILILVFARRSTTPNITDVQGDVAGVGVMGVLGNKGGAAVRLCYNDTTLCFVCSHLAASRKNVEARNDDYAAIIHKIEFTDAAREAGAKESDVEGDSGTFGVLDHDIVVWLGDLNYRIVEGISIEKCHERVEANDVEFLCDRDQLNIERLAGRVFHGFNEAPLTFLPTYKYQTGTDLYERRPDKKKRAPAWCDRVLWRCNSDDEHASLLTYTRTEQKSSDHKPVHALFRLSARTTVPERRAAVLREIMRKLDTLENKSIPQAKLSANVVDFGPVAYKAAPTAKLTVTNTGEVPAQWRFVPKLEEQVVCQPWLVIEPAFGMLLPGESVDIHMAAYVGAPMARALLRNEEELDTILILRLENGRDFFVTVAGSFLPSAFGACLEDLLYTPEPVRSSEFARAWSSLPLSERADARRARSVSTTSKPLRVPKEVWRLIDLVYARGMDSPGLFVEPGPEAECMRVREAIDTGAEVPPSVSALSIASVLLQLLASWQEPVVPSRMFPKSEFASMSVHDWCVTLLGTMPDENYNSFVYIVAFLREVLTHASSNGLTAALAAAAFAPALMWPPPTRDPLAIAEVEAAATAAGRPAGGPTTQRVPPLAAVKALERAAELSRGDGSAGASGAAAGAERDSASGASAAGVAAEFDLLDLGGTGASGGGGARRVSAAGAGAATPTAAPPFAATVSVASRDSDFGVGMAALGPAELPATAPLIDPDEVDVNPVGGLRAVLPAQAAAREKVIAHFLATPSLV